MDTGAAILVVDDEEAVRELLRHELGEDGHRVFLASSGVEALDLLSRTTFDLVVLDIMLPELDGIETLRRIRMKSMVPVIMLTAKSDEVDKVIGLEIGADDYVTKDMLSMREFRSRVRAHLRRAAAHRLNGSAKTLTLGRMEIDLASRTVRIDGETKRLTFVEFEILRTLCGHPGHVYSRDDLLKLVWGDSDFRDERTIDTHIRHLREKIEPSPSNPEYIFTVRNVGYRFREM